MVQLKHGLAALVASGLILAGTVPSLAQGVDDDQSMVPMAGNQFAKSQVVVPVGTTLTWVNLDGETHDVLSLDSADLLSPPIDPGQSWSYTFQAPGTYQYLCDLHANMVAVVTVTDSVTAAQPAPADY